jgi:hypothetical protein
LAGKQGFLTIRKTDFFAFFHFFKRFCGCKPLMVRILQMTEGSKKNRAQKPTVGFLIWAGSGKIIA